MPYEVLEALKSDKKEDKCTAILGMMMYVFRISSSQSKGENPILVLEEIFNIMLNLLKTNDPHYQFSIFWCVAWSGAVNIFPDKLRVPFAKFLLKSWIKTGDYNFHRVASWALEKILISSIPKNEISRIKNIRTTMHDKYLKPANEFDKLVSIYLGVIFDESFVITEVTEEFMQQLKQGRKRSSSSNNFFQFAKHLGIELKENSLTEP